MQCHFLPLIIFLMLKFALSEIYVAMTAFIWLLSAWYTFLHSFTFSLHVSSYLKWVSCRQCAVGFCFFDLLWHLCLLIGSFKPFISKMIIDAFGLISTNSSHFSVTSVVFLYLTFFCLLWFYWAFYITPLSLLSYHISFFFTLFGALGLTIDIYDKF